MIIIPKKNLYFKEKLKKSLLKTEKFFKIREPRILKYAVQNPNF